MRCLFLFGTLQHRPLLDAVLGHSNDVTIAAAVLPGFAVQAVAEGPFPTIMAQDGARAEGAVISGLTPDDHARLGFYEAAFGYALVAVTLENGDTAEAYFPQSDMWTPQGAWSLDDWIRDWGELSVRAATEVMHYLHSKRPHEVAGMFPMIRARAWSQINAKQSRHGAMTLMGDTQIDAVRRPYAHYFALEEYDLRHQRFDGTMTPQVERAVFRAPDAALVLPYDPVRDCVMLVEQMRMGPLARGDRALWQLEPIAGRLDPGEAPEAAARREAVEEAGLEMGELIAVAETYCSPGNSSEFYYIYVGLADLPERAAGLGGEEAEDEDIRSHILPFEQLMQMCDDLLVANAPLVMAAYWLARHRARLRKA
ncbi:NUDIX domain-containing protein [Roseobacter litoralis]|uniref:NUDIX domain-containing protein n=1 Tax=Roseobacter litoralis TaxID=42443 RepID=UPI00249575A2|nr:NUDIX domain-containing protein [Roseobacter litoralis]